MPISPAVFILTVCGIIAIVAGGTIGWAVSEARKGNPEHLVFWRSVKLVSAILGIIGLVILAVNIEKTVRDTVGGKAREYVFREFFDLKLYTAKHVSIVCSRENDSTEAKYECGDARNIDNALTSLNIRDFTPYGPFNWPRLPSQDTKKFMDEVNRRVSFINGAMPTAATADSFLSDEQRINFLFVAALVVVLALAGSIGESLYQLVIAIAQQHKSEASHGQR